MASFIGGQEYRIQGSGFRTLDDGHKVRILRASTLKFFAETTSFQAQSRHLYPIYDLSELIH